MREKQTTTKRVVIFLLPSGRNESYEIDFHERHNVLEIEPDFRVDGLTGSEPFFRIDYPGGTLAVRTSTIASYFIEDMGYSPKDVWFGKEPNKYPHTLGVKL